MINKITREFYLLTVLSNLGIATTCAIYVIFLREHGLSLLEVNMVNVAFHLSLTLFEIPTGAFADVFGRKASFLLSCLLIGLGLCIYAFSTNLWGFILAESVTAIGFTFNTGAFKAWFVDRLKYHGHTESFHHIFSKASQLKIGTGIIAALIGALLSEVWSPLPWLIGASFTFLCIFVALPIKEEYFIKQKYSFKLGYKSMRETVKNSFRYGCEDKRVRFILALVAIQVFVVQAPNMQWQPLFQKWMSDKIFFSFIWAGISLSMIFGAWISPKILKRFKCERKSLVFCHIITGIFMISAVATHWLPTTLLFFLSHEAARGSFNPLKDAYLHDHIPSKERSTIESFESLVQHGAGVLGLLASGVLAKEFGISLTWVIMGTILIIVTSLYIKNNKGHS